MNILILGANGQLARNSTGVFLRDTEARLTLRVWGHRNRTLRRRAS